MFDELKKKFGFGSSKTPETFPDPVKLALEESAKAVMTDESSLLTGISHAERLERGKRQRHDYKYGKGAYDEKIRKHREATIFACDPPSIEEIRRDFKSAFGGIGEPEPAAPMTAEEMSLIFKNTAHGASDGDGIPASFGRVAIKPEMLGKLNAGIDPSFMVTTSTGMGKTFHTGGFTGGIGSITAAMEEEKQRAERLRQVEQQEHERAELKRLSKAFVHGIGDEMSNEFANALSRGERSEFASEVLKRLIIAASNNGLDINELLEEIEMTEEEKTKEALALEALAQSITDYWGGVDYELSEDKFALTGPTSLTILRAPSETHKSGYGKKAHIGGEEFTGAKAYLGKRGQIICCFKPVGVEDYSQMEMPLGDCFAQLTAFQRHFVEQGFSAQYQAIRDAKNAEKQAADLEKFSEKYEDFGSF